MDNQQLSLEQRKAQRLSLTGVGSKRSRSGSLRFADDDIVCTPRKLGELSAIRLANVLNIIERIISGHNRGEPGLAPQTFLTCSNKVRLKKLPRINPHSY